MYTKIYNKFWTDPKVKKGLQALDKYLFIYFIANPHIHFTGLYYIPILLIEDETGMNNSEITKGIEKLQSIGVIDYDFDTEMVFVYKMFRYYLNEHTLTLSQKKEIKKYLDNIHCKRLTERFNELWHNEINNNKKIGCDGNETGDVREVFEHWNRCKIVQHRDISKFKSQIIACLKLYSIDEIKQAMSNYAKILKSDQYFWTYKWGLYEFLTQKNGLDKFLTVNRPFDNFKKKDNNGYKNKIPRDASGRPLQYI